MKTLYLECSMGAAGDMLTAALLELLPEERQRETLEKLRSLFPEKLAISAEKVSRCGILGTHMRVTVNGEEEESLDVHGGDGHTHHHGDDHEHCSDKSHECPHDDGLEHSHDDSHEHCHDDSHDHHSGHDSHDAHAHHHHHTSPADIRAIIGAMKIPDTVRSDALAVYALLADAESHAHGVPIEEIHFHEVGALDAVADITSVCLLMHEIAPEQVLISAVNTGSGQVRCAHGIMPVPAPATEYLLRGIPYYQSQTIRGELCTPTGAALLKYFGTAFGARPVMRIEKTGYGMGTKEFEAANCIRAFLGDAEPVKDLSHQNTTSEISVPDMKSADVSAFSGFDHVLELQANVDDMTAEEIGFAMDRLFDAGAREVFTVPVCMKKNRPGTLITAILSQDREDAVTRAFFRYTTTIGIRVLHFDRAVLKRSVTEKETSLGTVRVKTSEGCGVKRTKIEYDDAAAIARKTGMTLREVREKLKDELRQ